MRPTIIDNVFDIGQMVFLKTDPNQYQRVVFGIIVRKGDILYQLASGSDVSDHYDFEISIEKNVLMVTE